MTIGTDKEDNRYFVSSIDEQSSVFWMNHESESPGLNRWVCQNFSSFIKFQLGCNLPEIDRLWMGKQGLGKVISKKNPIEPRLNWSPFLIDRSEWIIQSIYLGNINEISESAFYFDWELEKEMLEKSEPLALYWLFRSFLLNEEQKFQDTYKVVNQLSPLITSACKILLTEWTLDDSESRFCIARAKIREIADKLKVAKQSPQIR